MYDPGAIGLLFCASHGTKPFNRGAHGAGTGGIGMGHARRINITTCWFIHDASDIIELCQRMHLFGLFFTDFVEFQTEQPCLGFLQAQLMLTLRCLRQI